MTWWRWKSTVLTLVALVLLILWMFPIFWMVSTSFKDSGEWVTWPPHWLPQAPTLLNYAQIFAFGELDPKLARQAAEQNGQRRSRGSSTGDQDVGHARLAYSFN